LLIEFLVNSNVDIMLRVITGIAKGTLLKVPETGLRPCTDLVRGAIFSILENLTEDWDQVLDLYSGSGALGIEALSREAGWVDFVDRERRCCDIIKQNLEKTGFCAQAQVRCGSVEKVLTALDKTYSIVLIDPPYPDRTIGNVLQQLADSKLVGESTIVVCTHSSRFKLTERYGKLKMFKEHRHGDSTISVFRENIA
jgi:16S rRNA (guanine966-N2)-methyltransferase